MTCARALYIPLSLDVECVTLCHQMSMHRMALLEDDMRSHFQVVAVTVGPKRSQKGQKIDDNGQGWTNPQFDENASANDQVFRVKVSVIIVVHGCSVLKRWPGMPASSSRQISA